MKKTIRAGVIGLGHLGSIHLKLINELCGERDNMVLTGAFDNDEKKNSEAAEKYGYQKVGSIDELLGRTDAVVIVTRLQLILKLLQKQLK